MSQDLHQRIQRVISANDVSSQSDLPTSFIERLGQFDPNIDQVNLFAKWEELEIRELALRYLAKKDGDWPLAPAPSGNFSSEDDDGEEETEDEEEQPLAQAPSEASMVSWLEEITGGNAQHAVGSPGFSTWALANRAKHDLSRWDASQALERARTVVWNSPALADRVGVLS